MFLLNRPRKQRFYVIIFLRLNVHEKRDNSLDYLVIFKFFAHFEARAIVKHPNFLYLQLSVNANNFIIPHYCIEQIKKKS